MVETTASLGASLKPNRKPTLHICADSVKIRCFDPRCDKARHVLRQFGINYPDALTLAGGGYGLVPDFRHLSEDQKIIRATDCKDDRRFIFRHARKAIKLHKVKLIAICCHEGCGAVADDGHKFSSPEQEFKFQLSRIERSAQLVRKEFPKSQFPDLVVAGFYEYFDSDGFLDVKQCF